ncbi:MAG TPA: hypothetical protein DCS04_04190, partial [Ruminococcaceae bacterium]|nr:hypothetical protein [Oscillospiraceae bacterium]
TGNKFVIDCHFDVSFLVKIFLRQKKPPALRAEDELSCYHLCSPNPHGHGLGEYKHTLTFNARTRRSLLHFSATQLRDVFGRNSHAFLHRPKALFASFFAYFFPSKLLSALYIV